MDAAFDPLARKSADEGSFGSIPPPPKRSTAAPVPTAQASNAAPTLDEMERAIVPKPPTDKKTGQPKAMPPEKKSTWDKLWTGVVSPKTSESLVRFMPGMLVSGGMMTLPIPSSKDLMKYAEQQPGDTRLQHAYRELAGYTAGWEKGASEQVSQMTSLAGGALEAAELLSGIGEAKAGEPVVEALTTRIIRHALRFPGRATGAYFAVQGAKMALTPQQEGENKYDSFWRRINGLSAFVGTAYSWGSEIHRVMPKFVQHYFGLSEDMAAKVSSTVKQVEITRRQHEGNIQAIDAETREQIGALRDNLQKEIGNIHGQTHSAVQTILTQTEELIEKNKAKLTDVQKQSLRDGARTVADTMQAFLQEKARVGAPFDKIGEQIRGDVAYAPEIQGIVEAAFKDNGLEPGEIPPKAVSLLKMPEPDEEGAPAGITVRGPDGKTVQVNEKYLAGWLEKGYERVGGMSGEGGLDFDRLTRVREDLGQAAESAKDTAQKRALFKARDDVTDLQEKIATKNGQGEAYRKAKNDYREFVRGIGSDMVHTFLDAADAEAQTMAPKISAMMKNREIGDGLRGVLKAAGVDVAPLDKLLETQTAIEEASAEAERVQKTRVAETEKTGRAKIAEAGKTAKEDIGNVKTYSLERKAEEKVALREQVRKAKATEIRGKKTIRDLFGKDPEELSGLDRQRLDEMLIRESMNRASAGGMGQWAYWTLGYGLLKLGMGSIFGVPGVIIGGSRVSLPRSLQNPKVQDWVIRQSGIDPATPAGVRARRGLTHLQRALRSGVPQAAAAKAAEDSFGEIPKRR